jgi:hypothetical protein
LLRYCTSCEPTLDDRVAELVVAKNLWVSVAGNKPYSYTLKFGQRSPYSVSVSNPGTLREDWLQELECSDVGGCRVMPTMRELFQFALELTGEQYHSGGDLIVTYDEDLGFPTRIFFDDHSGSHSSFSVEVSNVNFAP